MHFHTIESGRKLLALWSPVPFFAYRKYTDYVFRLLQDYTDCVCMDCRYGNSAHTHALLAQADLILVLLPQDRQVLQTFFAQAFVRRYNCLCLICDYDFSASCTVSEIENSLRVDARRLCILPGSQLRKTDAGTSFSMQKPMVLKEPHGFVSHSSCFSDSRYALPIHQAVQMLMS